ncbi:nucleoside hydrolase [uncultured Oscillibacter sp.]|uniref:nucleoside hydrolase n=1 Tax=uncultured Oscillibacter sp. TaxID=876091 RepID=UPI0026279DB7|nr:nucleoside hydrolase [uncultured Oscillibacter sp.]
MIRQKIICDCDPGHDDAVALMLAANSPELELLGVTVVAGNQTLDNTARNACRVLQWLGREDIPVYAGCGRPMVRDRITAGDIHGETGLDGPVFPPLRKAAEKEHAVSFLARTLLASEGDVTVVTTGPMTNLAMALRMEPGAAEKIRRIVLMGGSYTNGNVTPAAEFNILADPEAAHVCFTSGRPITMIGLDVTRKVLCYPAIVERMAKVNTRASRLFVDLMKHFCKAQKEVFGWEGGPLHDPVTIAALLDPALVAAKPMNVRIDLGRGDSYGRTNCDAFGYLGLPATADVAVDIDVERFWDIIEGGLRRCGETEAGA